MSRHGTTALDTLYRLHMRHVIMHVIYFSTALVIDYLTPRILHVEGSAGSEVRFEVLRRLEVNSFEGNAAQFHGMATHGSSHGHRRAMNS